MSTIERIINNLVKDILAIDQENLKLLASTAKAHEAQLQIELALNELRDDVQNVFNYCGDNMPNENTIHEISGGGWDTARVVHEETRKHLKAIQDILSRKPQS